MHNGSTASFSFDHHFAGVTVEEEGAVFPFLLLLCEARRVEAAAVLGHHPFSMLCVWGVCGWVLGGCVGWVSM
jgi:hypothetical protein